MIVIGLTGSIGMGKSAVAAIFAGAGVPVFDADAEVRRLQGPGGALLGAIERRFPGTTGPAGLDRQALGKAVFGNPAALADLESIMLPAVAAARRRFLRRHRARPLVLLDIPLLFEKRGAARVDAIVVASAPAWKQRHRVLARPGMTTEKFRRILRLQLRDAQKRRRADFIIPTGGTFHATRAAVRRVIACLMTSQGR